MVSPLFALTATPFARNAVLRSHARGEESWWDNNWARCAILSCACVYGTNFAAVKVLDSEVAPALAAALRFGLASTAALPILARQSPYTKDSLEIGAVVAIGYVAQAVGLQSVDATISAFVCSLSVIVVPALDALLLQRATSFATWAGCCLAALGVALLSFDGPSTPTHLDALGVVATGVQPLAFGYGFWRTEQLLVEAYDNKLEASLACAAAQLAAVKAAADTWLLLDYSLDLDDTLPHSLPDLISSVTRPDVLAAIAWTGLITTFGTVLVETVALSRISAKESSVLFTTEPLWGSMFATATLGEHLGSTATFGGFLILAACMLTVLSPSDAPYAPPPAASLAEILDS